MSIVISGLIILAVIIVVCALIYHDLTNRTVEESAYISNVLLYAIFLLLLAAVIKFVW